MSGYYVYLKLNMKSKERWIRIRFLKVSIGMRADRGEDDLIMISFSLEILLLAQNAGD
jgi:hypothetical protein